MTELKPEPWALEYELKQFIDIAIRYPIGGVHSSITKKNPYSSFFADLPKLRHEFQLFRTQLNQKLSESTNWKAIEIDLNKRFNSEIDRYFKWYEINKEKTELFGNYNPYEIINNISQSVKKEISDYFSDKSKIQIERDTTPAPFVDDESRDLFLYIANNWDYEHSTKWGYIWNFFMDRGAGKLTYKTDYENYIRDNIKQFRGKPNYDNCISEKIWPQLEKLKEQFDRQNAIK
jgi:hypothetical protein